MMLPPFVSGIVLLAIGGGVLAIGWQGYRTGVLPAGPNFFRGRYLPSRAGNPFAFHFFLVLYYSAGMALCVWGLMALAGMAPPLRLE
jgi:hypothetical protein